MKFAKVRNVKSPVRGTELSAGIDFFIPEDFKETPLYPGYDLLIPSGIKVEIPEGYMLLGADKSGVVTSKGACIIAKRPPKADAFETNLIVGAKIVDEDFQGELHIHLINVGMSTARLKPGMKIAQFILVPVAYDTLEEVKPEALFKESKQSKRGAGCFGSTGSY